MNNKNNVNPTTGLEIAVIGMAGKFPGANTLDEFWANLKHGVESLVVFSDQELVEAGVDRQLITDPNYVKVKGIIKDPEYFDASFFDYTPADAQTMDPQIRLFHECVWEALENAGYDPNRYKGLIGLFAGASNSLYWAALNQMAVLNSNTAASFANSHLTDKDYLTTLISYKLNLKGPSMIIQTACSTSLVAVHIACQELLTGGCNIALAGGVSVLLPQKSGYLYQEGMIMSPDGHCRAFDADARGTVTGEGLGVVVLKRLEDALKDSDHILAVIKGSNTNNDGSNKVGYTAPGIEGQSQMIKKAYYIAEVDPETVSYIEAHGTGTVLGDPIEIEALKNAFNASKRNYCAIGSVKTNIGHLDAAAGVAGLIKTTLSLHHKQIPPSLHYKSPNPKIDFTNSPFYVNNQLRPWPSSDGPLRAGVSSFGIGGTNAHVILEEAPPQEKSSASRAWQLLLLSAKTPAALQKISNNLADYLGNNPEVNLADLAYTLQVGRAQFKHRRTVVTSNVQDAIAQLNSSYFPQSETDAKTVIFMFPGQGAQYLNMGRGLYQNEPSFREEVDRCLAIAKPILPYDLKSMLYPENGQNNEIKINLNPASALQTHQNIDLPDSADKPDPVNFSTQFKKNLNVLAGSRINDTEVAQPLIFIFEYALAQLLIKWGIKPDAMIGDSIGEYVAACLAGVFTLEDYISNLTGNRTSVCDAINPEYWVKHLPNTVRFSDGLKEIFAKTKNNIFIEIGPGCALSTFVKKHHNYKTEQTVVNLIRHPQEDIIDQQFLLKQLGSLWSAGLNIDWKKFYQHERRYRIPLPTYPFERQHYGMVLNINDVIAGLFSRKTVSGPKRELDEWFYTPTWKRVNQFKTMEKFDAISKILVFCNETQFTLQMIGALRIRKCNLVLVKTGIKYLKENNDSYIVNPANAEDYQELFSDLQKSDKIPQLIIYAWTLNLNPASNFNERSSFLTHQNIDLPDSANEPDPANFSTFYQKNLNALAGSRLNEANNVELDITEIEKATELGFYGLLYLSQAIGRLNIKEDLLIKVITNNLYCVTGEEELSPEKAMVLGPVMVIPQEYLNLKCCHIDIELPNSGSKAEKQLIELLISDLMLNSIDTIIAYRGSFRWLPTYESVAIAKCQETPYRLRKNGIYLITGGFGGIGTVIAEYLAQTVQAKLILISRSDLPARTDWGKWLADHDQHDKISQKIKKIQEIEALGGEVLALKADVGDLIRMKEVLCEIKEKFGTINGIFHCAGAADGRMIQLRDEETTRPVLAPKVAGTVILNQFFGDAKLDFFILCSSINSIVTPIGQVGYCAANNFLDAFAYWHNRRQRARAKTFTIAINWDTWQEVGMAAEAAQLIKDPEALKKGILPTEGIEVIKRILGSNSLYTSGINQVIVSTTPFEERFHQFTKQEIPAYDTLLPQNEVIHTKRPDLKNAYFAPSNEIEERLVKIWRKLLGFSEIGVDDNYFELGGDSLKAMILIANINKEFNLELTQWEIYSFSTIREFAALVKQNKPVGPKPPQEQSFSHPFSEQVAAAGSLKILDGIEPFVDVFYQSCFYHALFPALRYFGREIDPVLANDVPIYSYDQTKSGIKLGISFIPQKEILSILTEFAIEAEIKKINDDLIPQIITSVSQNRPVIVNIDCFYETFRADTYQKTHWPHTLLVFGYDQSQKVLYILEHNDINSLNYQKKTISYNDLTNAYQGYLENFLNLISFPEYIELYSLQDHWEQIQSCKYQETFQDNLRNHRGAILDGLNNIKQFQTDLAAILTDETLLDKRIDNIIFVLTEIIKAKKVESYQVTKLLANFHPDLNQLHQSIIREWNLVKGSMEKYKIASKLQPIVFEKALAKLDQIYQLETQYYNALFKHIG